MPRTDAIVEFDGVSFAYGDDAPALHAIDCAIAGGEFVAVLGANGSGKSTLAKLVNGLLVPTEGEVRVRGHATSAPEATSEVRRHVGLVFQNPDNQAVAAVVRDDVAFGPENLGIDPADIRCRVADALERVGMADHADDQIASLSGGQKQLVAIAGVLAMRPDVVVLDEPGSMLDVRGRERIMGTLRDLHAQGMTIVLVTHFMEEAVQADRVLVLDGGTLAVQGTPREVFARADLLRSLRLELPFAVELGERLRVRGLDAGTCLDDAEMEVELCRLLSRA